MRFRYIRSKYLTTITLATLLTVAASTSLAQETPLSLTQVLTALQSTSSGMTLTQKNSFIIQRVRERGVTFSLTSQLTTQLTDAGAAQALIDAIKANGPQSNQTSTTKSTSKTPDINFSRLWVEQNVAREGRNGMIVHTEFTAYNLKDVPLQLTIRFLDSAGENLKSTNENFANKNGDLALYKNLNPGFEAVDYKDWSVFVPYDEMRLDPGTYQLKIDANIVYADGNLLKHMTLHEVTVKKDPPSKMAPRANFEKMWVDYGVKEGELLGMRIHVKLRTYNLKDTRCWLTIMFEKENGERLAAANTLYADRSGGVTLFSQLTPAHPVTVYGDISVFMPYDELNLPKGKHNLRMHADLVYTDGGTIQHLNYYDFEFEL